MSTPIRLIDPLSGNIARVTKYGEVITGDLAPSTTVQKTLSVDNLVYNLLAPKAAQEIIITGLVFNGDKLVSQTIDATVTLYKADFADGAPTAANTIISNQIQRNGRLVLTGIKLLVEAGKFINVTSSDSNIYVTLFYYRAKAL